MHGKDFQAALIPACRLQCAEGHEKAIEGRAYGGSSQESDTMGFFIVVKAS